MRILSVVQKHYYGHKTAIEPLFIFMTEPLVEMGHNVETFDHVATAALVGRRQCTDRLVDRIKRGSFDVVLFQSVASSAVDTEQLRDLSKRQCIIAWNSDDDWQWQTYTSKIARHFTYAVTTYRHILESNRTAFPNLLLSQWACHPKLGDFARPKDIDFSFAGGIYRTRNDECRMLRRTAGLQAFGRGARLVRLGLPYFKGAFKLPWLSGHPVDYEHGVYDIWNRSRISYTPLGGGPDNSYKQVKGRVFEMGASGTLMLCEHSADVNRYYEPGVEFVPFGDLADCADKARYYLRHESERLSIVHRYYRRTLAEHQWRHRFRDIFKQAGIQTANLTSVSA